MTIMREGRNSLVARTIIYGLSGLLLWFCFQPLLVLTILNAKLLLLLFIGSMLVMFYFKLPKWLCVTVCAGLILHAVHFYFFKAYPFLQPEWFLLFLGQTRDSFHSLWQGDAAEIPDVFSAFMFYLVFGFVLFTVNHWLEKGRIILFVALAMLSSLAIDTLTYFDGRQTIVVQAAVALALLSFHQWQNFVQKGDKTHSLRMTRSWFAVTGMVIAAFLLFALMLPKPDSLWKGPSNYVSGLGLSFFNNDSFFSGNQRIGYDDDDSRLGGSIAMDQTPLFTAAISGSPQYWRVAYKDHYTGHGWSNGNRYFMPISGSRSLSEMLTLYGAKTKKNEQTAVLRFSSSSPAILPYAGEPQQITVPGKQVKLDQLNGQLLTVDERKADQATIRYEAPSYHTSALRAPASANDPQIIRDTYLQLPQKLPKRVQTLAKRLTDGKANRYDQVNAVVNYLRSSRFTYSTDRVPVPSNDQDYVDQFLFASKVGYCDNFSTSLVVLLRSAGIPARWVKGFTSGEYVRNVQEKVKGKTIDLNEYRITNADAHSWGEVYFQGSGWVSFEATPSFSNPSEFASENSTNASERSDTQQQSGSSAESDQNQQSTNQKEQQQQKDPQQKTAKQNNTESQTKAQTNNAGAETPAVHWKAIAWTAAGILLAAAIAAFLTRKKWLRAVYVYQLHKKSIEHDQDFVYLFQRLLRVLALDGWERSDSETLREFAQRFDEQNDGCALYPLIEQYEQMIYRNGSRGYQLDAEQIRILLNRTIDHRSKATPAEKDLNQKAE
ncbi:DUF3488 and transglutaminase-like domain-containing protein [Sporolactobacillus terrae]|nr:DUF3488 and transglutaminase-like domain-containing protein [Sporolactobacillus terrae]